MDIATLAVTPLDAFHAQAKTHWVAKYLKKDDSKAEIEFDVIYFVQLRGNEPKIFAYITGDEQQAYKDMGIVPG